VSADSAPDLRGKLDFIQPSHIGAVKSVPMTIFRDGTGRLRPAQLGSCSSVPNWKVRWNRPARWASAFCAAVPQFRDAETGTQQSGWYRRAPV
jgi:hypothetical protein